MEYIELKVSGISGEGAEILTAELCELGFESFTEEAGGSFSAFIPQESFDIMKVANFLEEKSANAGFSYKVEKIEEENWNAAWESAYQPVMIEGCFIRAPFHQPDPSASLDIVIEPKMSFGTAHHETTNLMIRALLKTEFRDSSVLDIGTGTGVLGIVAARLGALNVVAIDNDEWSYLNAAENAERNNVPGMIVVHGDAADIPARKFNFVFANINRNVLLRDMPAFAACLEQGGSLFLSGFYEDDLGTITEAASGLGLTQSHLETLNHWVAVTYKKC